MLLPCRWKLKSTPDVTATQRILHKLLLLFTCVICLHFPQQIAFAFIYFFHLLAVLKVFSRNVLFHFLKLSPWWIGRQMSAQPHVKTLWQNDNQTSADLFLFPQRCTLRPNLADTSTFFYTCFQSNSQQNNLGFSVLLEDALACRLDWTTNHQINRWPALLWTTATPPQPVLFWDQLMTWILKNIPFLCLEQHLGCFLNLLWVIIHLRCEELQHLAESKQRV